MRIYLAVAASTLLLPHLGALAAPSLPLDARDDECRLSTNTASGLYDLSYGNVVVCPKYAGAGGECARDMVGRIATPIQYFLDAPTNAQRSGYFAVYQCTDSGPYPYWRIKDGCRFSEAYKNIELNDAYLKSHKYLIIPTHKTGDEICCGYYDHAAKTRATCDKPSDYTR